MTKRTFLLLGLAMAASLEAQDRHVRLRGRVLEKANLAPVPGAMVDFLGTGLKAVTNSQGEFELSGSTAARSSPGRPLASPRFQGCYLVFPDLYVGVTVRAALFDLRGKRLAAREFQAAAGRNRLDLLQENRGRSEAFLSLEAGGATFRFKVLPGVATGTLEGSMLPAALLAKSSAASQLEIVANLLARKTVDLAADTGKVPDIVLDYPPRRLDVGAPPIYGSKFLFDGNADSSGARAEMEAKWMHWVGPWRQSRGLGATPVLWKIRPDPDGPGNPHRFTLSPCCLPRDGSPEWGYDDLQSKEKFKDFQLHIEFNMWGGPNDVTAGAYSNSGVYLQGRYEIQIESPPDPWDPNNRHGIASIIEEFPPDKNAYRPPGKWQAYDITFRSARWNGNTRTDKARMTIHWNGILVHNNRESGGPLAIPSVGGAGLDSTSQGLKLQNEKGTDVRYRNIWVKELSIPKPETNFGY